MKKLFLGIDCGLTSIKTILFDDQGKRYSFASKENEVFGGKINTCDLWSKVVDCIKKTIEVIDARLIEAISISGHGNGLYLSVDGKPYHTAYSSMFVGAEKSSDEISNLTLQTSWSGQPLNILSKIKQEDVNFFNKIDKIYLCKDFIRYKLTGEYGLDYSDASAAGLLDNNTYTVNKKLFELFDLSGIEKLLPPIYTSYEIAGRISKECSAVTGLKEGIPVATGAFDVCSCMVGSTVFNVDSYSIISGTWGINAALSNEKINDRNITQCCSFIDNNTNVCIESAPTSCVNLEWFLKNVRPDVKYADLPKIFKRQTDLIYLPYIYPSMRNPEQKASFVNLGINHTYEDMIKAIMEGVVFGHRVQVQALNKVGLRKEVIVLSGGASNSDEWCQLFADILKIKIYTLKEKQCGALGAAVLAAVACGYYKNINQAIKNMVYIDKEFCPNNNYEEKFAEFCKYLGR